MDRIPLIIRSSRPDVLQRAREALALDSGLDITHELPLIDGFSANVDAASLERLRGLGDEVQVAPDVEITLPVETTSSEPHVMLDLATRTLLMDEVWDHGLRGQGVGIAIIDTGIAPHPDLAKRVVAFHDSVNGKNAMYDDHGHGSHVSGIAAGDGSQSGGRYKGIAPEASLVGVKVLNEKGTGRTSAIVDGIQWAVQNRQRYNIRAMNVSIGGKAWTTADRDPLSLAVSRAVQSGIVVAVAAGNSGPNEKTVETPGICPDAITVANLDQHWSAERDDDSIADSSSRGPTRWDGLMKPDVCAPGTYITSCDHDNGYVAMSGTSMATPMVAGTTALLAQAHPEMPPDQIRDALIRSTAPLADVAATTQGFGMIDPPAAVASAAGK